MRIETDGVYIVTGGAGSLAGAIAQVFHQAGARLALAGPHAAPLEERAGPFHALAIEADLTSDDQAARMAAAVETAFGRIDGLICTAGGFDMAPARESGFDLYQRMCDLNLRTLVCSVQAVLPRLLHQRSGFIAGISAGIIRSGGGAGMTAYAASKGAVTAYLHALDAEVRGSGIATAIVYPLGAIDTPPNRRAMPGQDPGNWVDPIEIANALLFAATRGARGDLTELAIGVRR
jgi:NAD(P)-dependent dehydrogenase (short-subunit alcohol dehydrogenase family)